MKKVLKISSIKDLYDNQDQPTGEVFLDAVVSAMKEMQELSVAQISKAVGVDSSTLSSVVKILTGNTLAEMIEFWRWQKIQNLLTQTDLPYEEVAHQCGIANVTGLHRITNKNLNMTPLEIREQKKRRHWKQNM